MRTYQYVPPHSLSKCWFVCVEGGEGVSSLQSLFPLLIFEPALPGAKFARLGIRAFLRLFNP